MIVDAEWNRRQANKLSGCICAPDVCMEGIEYFPKRKLDKTQMLCFTTCRDIEKGRHIILSSGGKTYIICTLGNTA
jgi:hypothetical protein